MKTRPLSPRQHDVLAFLCSHAESHGFPPTRQEIADHLGVRSCNAVDEHLNAIRRKGYIELVPNASRGIVVLHTPTGAPAKDLRSSVLAWLGFWRDAMPPDAVRKLQDLLGVPPAP